MPRRPSWDAPGVPGRVVDKKTRQKPDLPPQKPSNQNQEDVVDMAQALISILHRSRTVSWGFKGPQTVPWHERAAIACAKLVIDLKPENDRLRARVAQLEALLIGEGKTV